MGAFMGEDMLNINNASKIEKMKKDNKVIWFEVRTGGCSGTFSTKRDAFNDLEEMKKGYPLIKHMTDENHAYWLKMSKVTEIYKVTQTSTKIN